MPVQGYTFNTKMDVKEKAEECVWINLGHDSDQQQKIVNVVLNICFTKKGGGVIFG